MATYLPNLSDNIQPIQIFTPNWQFFQAALQQLNAKQRAAVSSLENAYYIAAEAELTHQDNRTLREEWLKTYKDSIQKLANIDLTKQENINYAKSLFDVILDNNSFIDDYIKTKHIRHQLSFAEENTPYYNDISKKALELQLYQYAHSDYQARINMQPFNYIPKIDETKLVIEQLQKINPEIKTITKSGDDKYIITKTNGEKAVIPLANISALIMKSDPRIKETFKQESYVNRMSALYTQGPEKGLQQYQKIVSENTKLLLEFYEANASSYTDKLKSEHNEVTQTLLAKIDLAKSMKMSGVDLARTKSIIDDINLLNERRKILEANIQSAIELHGSINRIDTSIFEKEQILLSSQFDDLYADIKLLGRALDFGRVYATLTSKEDIEVNPYKLEEFKQNFEMRKTLLQIEGELDKERIKNQSDFRKNLVDSTYFFANRTPSNINYDDLSNKLGDIKDYVLKVDKDAKGNVQNVKIPIFKISGMANLMSGFTRIESLNEKKSIQNLFSTQDLVRKSSSKGHDYYITFDFDTKNNKYTVYAYEYARPLEGVFYQNVAQSGTTVPIPIDKNEAFYKKEFSEADFKTYFNNNLKPIVDNLSLYGTIQ